MDEIWQVITLILQKWQGPNGITKKYLLNWILDELPSYIKRLRDKVDNNVLGAISLGNLLNKH